MGTLFDQPVRRHYELNESSMIRLIDEMNILINDYHFTAAGALKFLEIYEMRRKNNLQKDDNDIWDEQIGGIGKLLEEFNSILRDYFYKNEL